MGSSGSHVDLRRVELGHHRSLRLRPLLGLLGIALPLAALPVQADVKGADGPRGLGTMVNGVRGGSCGAGLCEVSGGTRAGRNLFHGFADFNTRGGISGVRIQSDGFRNVMVGVMSRLGSFIDKPVSLSSKGNLFWLSPGGIQIIGAGSFQNVQHLQLSTATGLRFGTSGLWNVLSSTAEEVASLQDDPIRGSAGLLTDATALQELGLQANGDLSLDGGTLTVEESLLLDSQGGNVLLQAAGLQAPGGVVEVSGREVLASNSSVDVSRSDGMGGRVAISAERVQLSGSRLDASGRLAGGEVSLEAVQNVTLTATDVVVRGGAAVAPDAAVPSQAPAQTGPDLAAPPTAIASATPMSGAATVESSAVTAGPMEPAAATTTAEAFAATAPVADAAVAQVDPMADGAGVPAPTAVAVVESGSAVEAASVTQVSPSVEVAAVATEPQLQPSIPQSLAAVTPPAPEQGGRGGRIRLRGQQVEITGGQLDASGGQAEGSVSLNDGSSGSWQQPQFPQPQPVAEALAVQPDLSLAAPVVDQAAPVADQAALGSGGSVSIEADTVTQHSRIAVSGTSGGAVAIMARESLISEAPIEASGSSGSGGLISLQAGLNLFQGQTSWLVANGVSAGGVIQVIGGQLLETSGRYQALGSADQGVGGLIELTGRSVTLDGVSADASGGAGGGVIHVGGAERGADLQSGGAIADTVSVGPGSTLVADAVRHGDGGRVIVYADNAAVIDGQLSVRGGSEAGNGGFVETSADRLAVFQAPLIDADAGRAGTWLIDPTDLHISATGGLPTSPSLIGGVSYVAASALNSALNSDGAHVILETSASGTGAGNLFIDSPIALSAATGPSSLASKLTLKAHGDIYIDASISGANFRPLNVDLIADSDATGGGGVQWGSATLDLKGGKATVLKAVVPGLSPESLSPTTLGDLTIKPLSSATLAANSSLQTGSLTLQSGALQVNGILDVDGHYQQSGGTLSGSGDVNLNGSGSWTGGTITGAGTLRIASSKSFAISAGQGAFEAFGSVSYVGSLTDFLYSGTVTSVGVSTTVSPQQGASMLKIAPLTASAGDLTQFLGIDRIALDQFTSPKFATTGSGIRFNLAAGDVLSYDWYFASVDYIPWYDASFYVVSDGTPVDLARVGSADVNQWKSSQYVAASSSSYGIGVVNVQDQAYNSYVLIDNLKINGQLLADVAPSDSRVLGGGRQIDNQGTINWNAGSVILEGGANAAIILNSGTFNINADVDMGSRGGASTLVFRNQSTGQLVKTAGTGRASLGSADSASVDLDNDGLVDVKAGTLALYAPASSAVSTGTFRAASSGGASLPALEFAQGVTKVGAGAVLAGNVRVATDATLDLITGQKTFRSLSLVNDGVVNWSAGNIDLQSAVAITNNGLFNAFGSNALDVSTPAALRMAPMSSVGLPGANALQFENNGQLVKTGAGSVYFGVPASGSGTIDGVGLISGSGLISVEQGLLSFTAGALEGGLDLGIGGISPELRIGNTSYVLASPIAWDGGGGADISWFNALNWAGDVLPGAGSSVFIGNNINVGFSGGSLVQIASLSAGTGSTFSFGGGSLSVLGSVNLDGLYQQTGGSLTVGGGLFANRFSLSGSSSSITGGATSGGFVVGGGGVASTYSQTAGVISGFASVKIIVDTNGTAGLSKNIELTGTAALPATLSARDRLELDAREGLINLSYASLAATQSNQLSTVDLRAFSGISVVDSSIVAPAAKFELRAANGGGIGALTITRSILNAAAGTKGGDGGEIRGYGSSIALDQSSMVTSGSTTGGKILLGDSQSGSVQVTATTLVADPPAASGGQIALNGSVVGLGAGTVLNVVGTSGGSLSIGGATTSSVSIAPGVVLQASPTALSSITAGSPVVGQLTLQVVDLTPLTTSAPPSDPPPQPLTQQPSQPVAQQPPADQAPVSTGPSTPADSQPTQPSQPVQPIDPPVNQKPVAQPPSSPPVEKVLNSPAVQQVIGAPPLQPVVSQAPPPPSPVPVVEPAPAPTAPAPATDTTSSSSASASSGTSAETSASNSNSSASSTTAVAPVPQGLDVSLETGASFEVFGDLSSTSAESLATALLASTGVTIAQSAASLSTTEIAQSLVAIFSEAAFEVASSADSLSNSIAAFGDALVGSTGQQQDAVSSMLLGANQANADEAVASTASPGSAAGSSDGSATSTSGSEASGDSSKSSASSSGVAGSGQPAASVPRQEATASFQSGEQKSLQDAVTKLGISGQGSNAVVPTPQQVQMALVRIQQFVRTQLQRNASAAATR